MKYVKSIVVGLSAGANPVVVPVALAIATDTFSPQELYADGLRLARSTSSAIAVNPDTASQLQILLPGETTEPGSVSGKTGSPSAVSAGSTFTVTVNLTDAKFNLVAGQPLVKIRTLDPDDPVRFDFALAHVCISNGCRGRFHPSVCPSCALKPWCIAA